MEKHAIEQRLAISGYKVPMQAARACSVGGGEKFLSFMIILDSSQ